MPNKAVKLDDHTCERLKALGERRRRSPHWLMREAIQQFLDREEEAERIRQDTLERLARYETAGETIDHAEVESWLETWGTDRESKWPTP